MRVPALVRRARLSPSPRCTVTDTTARIAFHADRACRVQVRYVADGGSPVTSAEVELRASLNHTTPHSDYVGRIDLAGLTADTVYTYRFVVDGFEERAIPPCTFRTFPAAGSAVTFTFAWGSCNGRTRGTGNQGTEGDPTYADGYMYAQTFGAGARFVLYLGDWIYADDEDAVMPTPSQLVYTDHRSQHRHACSDHLGFPYTYGTARMCRGGPVFTMFDDHEFVNDFSGKNKTDNRWLEAAAAWGEYTGRANPDPVTAGEYYYTFAYGNVGFFVVDGRTFRATIGATDDAAKVYLGPVQLQALKDWLLANNETYSLKVIATSTSVSGHGTTGSDSWGGADDNAQVPTGTNGYRTERNDLLDYIRTNAITGVLFVSGDNHTASLIRFTVNAKDFYDFSASPFNRNTGTAVVDAADLTNGPVYFKYSAGRNHGMLTLDTTVATPTATYQLYNQAGSLGASFLKQILKSAL